MTLTKDALISEVAKANGYPRNQSVELIETLLEIIKSMLVSGEDVMISNFGKFCVKEKRARRGRNPATGEDMMLDARRGVTFKCSGRLQDKINHNNLVERDLSDKVLLSSCAKAIIGWLNVCISWGKTYLVIHHPSCLTQTQQTKHSIKQGGENGSRAFGCSENARRFRTQTG